MSPGMCINIGNGFFLLADQGRTKDRVRFDDPGRRTLRSRHLGPIRVVIEPEIHKMSTVIVAFLIVTTMTVSSQPEDEYALREWWAKVIMFKKWSAMRTSRKIWKTRKVLTGAVHCKVDILRRRTRSLVRS